MRTLVRARLVLPITAPPLEDGAVLVSGGQLAAIGPWSELSAEASDARQIDLGEVVLLPGFLNAHCHLDYTGFAGMIPPPRSFTEWIQGVLALKAQWSFTDYAASWVAGARQLVESGCTSVLDCESVPELLPDVWTGTPLRVISALEMTGVRSERSSAAILGEAMARLDHLTPPPRSMLALAPHAPYSTKPDLLAACAAVMRERGTLATLHLAESIEEYEMFRHASGPMHAWLRAQRDMSDCGVRTPVAAVAQTGILSSRMILAHVNHVEDEDLELLARSGASVAHCPRSHAYFGHAPFPLTRLLQAGVRVVLGTDSLLSVRKTGRTMPRLDLFAELRAAAEAFPGLGADRLLRMVTCESAQALGFAGRAGCLEPGVWADLIGVPYTGGVAEAADFVVRRSGPVTMAMIGGTWVHGPMSEGGADGRGEVS
ncbi:MAG: amidohydrolase family protein [Verrucomicrobiales bacterium]|nr:amidohydrolase family protein [Verrucomicrobiales bacterium]